MLDITIKTLGKLKTSGYVSKTIKDELRDNLITKIKSSNDAIFEDIHGLESSVMPELEQAILSGHNINLLGLRGQAKTKIARKMVNLLDEYIPIVEGSEINDDPLNPISRYAKDLVAQMGNDTPIKWIHRSERFFEKLATPDVTVADLIGDVDPIKAAHLKLSYADERVIHFGMIPRGNRCIFVINELPDLQARIQVSLFNILQESDIQIRGFKLRIQLDIQFIFTANPEDYTNRGSIVTPLKDRIGSQILTHYPKNVQIAKTITQQEAKFDKRFDTIHVPELAKDLIEYITFTARENEYIDNKSGVSARMSITAFENLLSTAERRMFRSGEEKTTIRLSDFMGITPAITGKIELSYEGEQQGVPYVVEHLIKGAVSNLFSRVFSTVSRLEKNDTNNEYTATLNWFSKNRHIRLMDDNNDEKYKTMLDTITPLNDLIKHFNPHAIEEDLYFLKELALWGLAEQNKLSKERIDAGHDFRDSVFRYR